ncbi:MAG: hypothetical protein EOP61_31655 [Sphingomonadales bacterium]|nr:MAG: hypothetical protein EOP61_31655 [Sphingomonadales bacterium]
MKHATSLILQGEVMKNRMLLGLLLASSLGAAPTASASVYTDELSKCLVEKTTKDDHVLLIKWVFSAVSSGAEVKPLSTITSLQRQDFSRSAGNLTMRLLTVDCRQQTVKAVKYDGTGSIQTAFELLGRVAMQALMADPAVLEQLEGLAEGLDLAPLVSVFVEAGIKPQTSPVK